MIYCTLLVKGILSERFSEWFSGLRVETFRGNTTLISGCLPDQPALLGIINQIHDLGMEFAYINCYTDAGTASSNLSAGGKGNETFTNIR